MIVGLPCGRRNPQKLGFHAVCLSSKRAGNRTILMYLPDRIRGNTPLLYMTYINRDLVVRGVRLLSANTLAVS